MASHLTGEQLADFQDGGLAQRDASHLEACADCKARLRDLELATAAYAEYRDTIRGPMLAPPPKPWRSLAALATEEPMSRREPFFRGWPVGAIAAAACIVAAVFYRPVDEASVRVNDLLVRSTRVTASAGSRVAMRYRGRRLTRPAMLTSGNEADGDPELKRVGAMFLAARYSWSEPLSARSFLEWRKELKHRQDRVTVIREGGEAAAYRVRTEDPGGVLRSAALTLRGEELRPTSGSFDFTGEETLEVTEETSAQPVLPKRAAPAKSSGPAEEVPAGPEVTLHVLAALDEIGADVGEPIEVSEDQEHGNVLVRASGLSPHRQEEIARVLKPLARVVFEPQYAGPVAAPGRPATVEKLSTSIPDALRNLLESRLGGAVALQEITDRVLEASASVVARSHAVALLASKFPVEVEMQLTTQDRELLNTLRQRHVAEMERLVSTIHTELKPLMAGATGSPGPPGEPLVTCTQDADTLLNRLLASSYSQESGEDMLRMLTPRINRLERAIHAQQTGRR